MTENTPDEKAFIKVLGTHLVALCGSYVQLDDNGEQIGEPKFYSYTGTVIEILGTWCIATAGHCIERIEKANRHPNVRIETQVLADYFGPGATNFVPIPFKPLGETKVSGVIVLENRLG